MLLLEAVSAWAFCFPCYAGGFRERRGVSCDIQMVNKLPVHMLAMRECTSVLLHKAVLGALGIDEQVGQ